MRNGPEMDALRARLAEQMDELIASGREEGMQLSVYQDGYQIIDITRGTRDDAGTPLSPDDLVLVWSTSKGVTAAAIHLLAEQDKLEYDDPICRYWPQFARNGKEGITIRHILSHTAGIPDLPADITPDTMANWQAMMELFVEMTPVSVPGKVAAYHGLTYGWPLGEIVRRIDGRSFPRFVQDEICTPLGIKGLFFGVPAEHAARKARLSHDIVIGPADVPLADDPTQLANNPLIQTACIPAANMMASARSIARFYASLVGTGVNGHRLLPQRRVTNMTTVQRWAMDQTLVGRDMGFGLGYILGSSVPTMSSRQSCFGHDGYGGAIGYADPEHNLAVGFTKTRMTLNPANPSTSLELMQTIRTALQIPE
ncbi:MAG: hypothetical protein RLZZ297_1319 [Chloroflexota bacterium]|jgi:CubicO group peptidase (beta-lactamase class C family)